MKVFVVRHGETDYNRARRMQGYGEVPLNDRGIRQAAQLARHLVTQGVEQIVCSDLRRTVMTGCIIASQIDVRIDYDPGLRERDPGDLVGASYDDAPGFFTDPNFVPPNGEGVPAFRQRVRETFTNLCERYGNTTETLLVVTHGLVCHAFVEEFFGAAFSEGVGSGNGTLSIARVEKGVWHLEKATCDAHLSDRSQTVPGGAQGA